MLSLNKFGNKIPHSFLLCVRCFVQPFENEQPYDRMKIVAEEHKNVCQLMLLLNLELSTNH